MSTPIIADNKPKKVSLTAGEEYYFCTCGRSAGQPFCDGSHAGTSFTPRPFVAEEDGDAYLCACKHTKNAPFCDGSHKRFTGEEVGKQGPGSAGEGATQEVAPTAEEPTVAFIHELARDGLSKLGHHGPMTAMGVPRHQLPHWDDIQIMAAQLATRPLMEDQAVQTELVIGPEAKRPLTLKTPLFVSDCHDGQTLDPSSTSGPGGGVLEVTADTDCSGISDDGDYLVSVAKLSGPPSGARYSLSILP